MIGAPALSRAEQSSDFSYTANKCLIRMLFHIFVWLIQFKHDAVPYSSSSIPICHCFNPAGWWQNSMIEAKI